MKPLVRCIAGAAVLAVLVGPPAAATTTASPADPGGARTAAPSARAWVWPLGGFRIAEPYAAPAHAYGAGHRGIDLEPRHGARVRSPASGVVAFAGTVAGRGVLTIDHGGGLVTTLEPISSQLRPGDAVGRGQDVGDVAVGGHAAPGTIHFGVRLNGIYINPMRLIGGVPRAVLLPCCG
jgi:murein DD-endopeptidase MepM/ murein hydrolase activator NlpD